MRWHFSGSAPVYQQIMEQIRFAILSGEYPPGVRVPAVREWAMAAGVNPNTMQRALSELEREGLLVCCGTMGRFVADDEVVLARNRRAAQQTTITACVRQLSAVGLTLEQAAAMQKEESQ